MAVAKNFFAITEHVSYQIAVGTINKDLLHRIITAIMAGAYNLDGTGRTIIDDMSCEELAELIAQIDHNGKTDEPIYYQERVMLQRLPLV